MNRVKLLSFGCRAGIFALLGLAGCTSPSKEWVRTGTSDTVRDADYQDCRSESQHYTNGRVDQDLLASRASQSVGGLPPTDPANSFTSQDAEDASKSLITCMTDKGYRSR